MSPDAGAISGLEVVTDAESFTDEDVGIEGRWRGKHVGEFRNYAPTNRKVELPFVTFYRFDSDDKLASERAVMNLSALRSSEQSRMPRPGIFDTAVDLFVAGGHATSLDELLDAMGIGRGSFTAPSAAGKPST